MKQLWLVCDKHKDNCGWKHETNVWGLRLILCAWEYGYRRIRLVWK